MKECDNSTRKIHISSNFILSISLLIMFDTLPRPSLHCKTPLHFTTLHPTTLHYTYRHFTSYHLHFTSLIWFILQPSLSTPVIPQLLFLLQFLPHSSFLLCIMFPNLTYLSSAVCLLRHFPFYFIF